MKICAVCSSNIDDSSIFCGVCGAKVPITSMGQVPLHQMNQGVQSQVQSQQIYQGGHGQVTLHQMNQGVQSQVSSQQMNQGVHDQNFYQSTWDNQTKKQKRNVNGKSKAPIIIIFSSVLVIAIAAVLSYIFVFSTKAQIKGAVNDYVDAINDMDVEEIVSSTIPGHASTVILDLAEIDYDDIKYLINDMDVEVDIDDLDIEDVHKINLEDELMEIVDLLDLDREAVIRELGDLSSATYDDLISLLEEYGVNSDEIYEVGISFDIEISIDNYFIRDLGYTSDMISSMIDSVYVYKCEDEWLVLPISKKLISSVAPILEDYAEKVRKSNDIFTAKQIKTAIESALGDEYIYEELTTTYVNQLIDVTNEGLSSIDAACSNKIVEYLDYETPTVEYTENGASHFCFMITEDNTIKVYTTDGDETWELTPQICDEY